MLVSILRDESAEPTTLELLLEDITNIFSTEQEVDQGEFGMVYKTSSVPKFRRSGEESEASLLTPSPTSGKDSLNYHQEIKKSPDEEKVVIKMGLQGDKAWGKIMETAARCEGVSSIAREGDNLVVVGRPVRLVNELHKLKFDAVIASDGKEETWDPLPPPPYPPPELSRMWSVLDSLCSFVLDCLLSFSLYLFGSGDLGPELAAATAADMDVRAEPAQQQEASMSKSSSSGVVEDDDDDDDDDIINRFRQ